MHRFTKTRSTIDPTIVVNGDGLRSTPIGSSPAAQKAHQCLAQMSGTAGDENGHRRDQYRTSWAGAGLLISHTC
jgi:hypothetical protein